MRRRDWMVASLVCLLVAGTVFYRHGRSIWHPVYRLISGRRGVEDVVRSEGPGAESRLRPYFERGGVSWPPVRVTLLVFKEERSLELWSERAGRWVLVRTYPVRAASGHAGPKLREGDGQVPEGVYRVVGLNPRSAYHLSLKLDYPNDFDRRKAAEDGRSELGGDIFVHGKAVSIGCIAVGDEAVEELFLLTTTVGCRNVRVIIAPNDVRGGRPVRGHASNPAWVGELYERIRAELAPFAGG